MLHALCKAQYDKDIWKIKNLEKLFRKNKTSPLLKTQEKDFQLGLLVMDFLSVDIFWLQFIKYSLQITLL